MNSPSVKDKDNLQNTCKWWGVGLILAGIIPFLFPETFDMGIGILAILLGIVTLVFRDRWNLAVVGAFILLIGVWNIIASLLIQEYTFLFGGVIQIAIGVTALNQYLKIKGKKREIVKSWYKKWWGISLTIIGIYLIFSFIYGALNPGKVFLEEDYEVDYFSCGVLEPPTAQVEMKSLGNREDQVRRGLIYLSMDCPDSTRYSISIIEPTRECNYFFNGEIIRMWLSEYNESLSQEQKETIENDLDFIYWKFIAEKDYSDPNKRYSELGYAYEDYLENGITKLTALSMVYYKINDQTNCE